MPTKVELLTTASVTGDIVSPLILMEDGAVVTGRIDADGRKRAAK